MTTSQRTFFFQGFGASGADRAEASRGGAKTGRAEACARSFERQGGRCDDGN